MSFAALIFPYIFISEEERQPNAFRLKRVSVNPEDLSVGFFCYFVLIDRFCFFHS